jgi:hypothetical protein
MRCCQGSRSDPKGLALTAATPEYALVWVVSARGRHNPYQPCGSCLKTAGTREEGFARPTARNEVRTDGRAKRA